MYRSSINAFLDPSVRHSLGKQKGGERRIHLRQIRFNDEYLHITGVCHTLLRKLCFVRQTVPLRMVQDLEQAIEGSERRWAPTTPTRKRGLDYEMMVVLNLSEGHGDPAT